MKKKGVVCLGTMISSLVLTWGLALADPTDVAIGPPLPQHLLAPLSEAEIADAKPLPLRIFDEVDGVPGWEAFGHRPQGKPIVFPSKPGKGGLLAPANPTHVAIGPPLPRHLLAPLSEAGIADAKPMPLPILDKEDGTPRDEWMSGGAPGSFPGYAGDHGGGATSVRDEGYEVPGFQPDLKAVPADPAYLYPMLRFNRPMKGMLMP